MDLDSNSIQQRQARLVETMAELGVETAILTRPESVQWLTGAHVGPLFQPTASIDAAGRVVLVLPSRKVETPSVAAEVTPYEEKRLSTMRDASDQRNASVEQLLFKTPLDGRRTGVEASVATKSLLQAAGTEAVDIDAALFALRRRKHADELAMMARANEANEAMYRLARERITRGLNELDLYNELQAVAVRTLGEPLTYFGQDFRCAARGGPPRDRVAADGELWILDLGVGYRGYYSDNARTIAVSEPTALQQEAWDALAAVFDVVQQTVRPGASCAGLYETVNRQLADFAGGVFNHHLGHGVGLAPHEAPRLNPNWDDQFEVGDFFTVEPGLYSDELNHGIRLEQNYVVTESGVELLTDWPLGL